MNMNYIYFLITFQLVHHFISFSYLFLASAIMYSRSGKVRFGAFMNHRESTKL